MYNKVVKLLGWMLFFVLMSYVLSGCDGIEVTPPAPQLGGSAVGVTQLPSYTPPAQTSGSSFISTRRAIDFLFILDHSSKNARNLMAQTLSPRFKNFPSQISHIDIDWRIYFLTSSVSTRPNHLQPNLMPLELNGVVIDSPFLSTQMAQNFYESQPGDIFIDTLSYKQARSCKLPPYCASRNSKSQPLRVLNQFLKESGKQILREEAELAVIIITNSDEEVVSKNSIQTSPSAIVQSVQSIFSKDKKFYSAGIIPSPSDKACSKQKYARHIASFILETEGVFINICDPTENIFTSELVQLVDRYGSSHL